MRPLERRYRALLRFFPATYLADREEEMVGTLLDAAGNERHWPSANEAWDLMTSAATVRFGHATGGSMWWSALEGFRWAGTLLLAWKAAGALADAFFALRWVHSPEVIWGSTFAALLLAIVVPAALLALLFGRPSTGRLAVAMAAMSIAFVETARALSYSGPADPAWLAGFVLPRSLPVLAASIPSRRGCDGAVGRPLSIFILVAVGLAATAIIMLATAFSHHPGLPLAIYRWVPLLTVLAATLCLVASLWDPRVIFGCLLFVANSALRDVLAALQYRNPVGLSGPFLSVMAGFALGLLAVWWARRRALVR